MNLSCFLDAGACINTAVATWIDWFPFGIIGVAFTAGLIIGAVLGKWGVGVLIALAVALKVASVKEPDLFPHEDPKPVPVKPKKKGLWK